MLVAIGIATLECNLFLQASFGWGFVPPRQYAKLGEHWEASYQLWEKLVTAAPWAHRGFFAKAVRHLSAGSTCLVQPSSAALFFRGAVCWCLELLVHR